MSNDFGKESSEPSVIGHNRTTATTNDSFVFSSKTEKNKCWKLHVKDNRL